MIDPETREVLINVCEAVKADLRYLLALHRSLAALYDAIKRDHPEIQQAYQEEATPIREHPEAHETLDRVDELLQQLRKR